MDKIERQPQSARSGIRQARASGIRQDGAKDIRKGAQPAREGGDATRHVRDILQYDARG